LRIIYFGLLQDEIFCRYQLGSFDLWCHLVLGFLCWFFGWPIYWWWGGINVSHNHCVRDSALLSPLVYVWWS
jgi:hypothetical protein